MSATPLNNKRHRGLYLPIPRRLRGLRSSRAAAVAETALQSHHRGACILLSLQRVPGRARNYPRAGPSEFLGALDSRGGDGALV